MLRRCDLCAVLFLAIVLCGTAAEERSAFQPHTYDWPQWQGPLRTGLSQETGLLKSWPEEGPPLVWKAKDLGEGWSAPSIAAGRIFTMGDRGSTKKNKTEHVIALEERTGKELWATPIGPGGEAGGYHGPRCTPTVDGNYVYALGLQGDLLCLDVESGKIHWRKSFKKDYHGSPGGWGYCESPFIDGDKVVCTPGGKEATLLALNKKSGETVWKSAIKQGDQAAYASIVVNEMDGLRQYIAFLSGGAVGVAGADGRLLWRYSAPWAGIKCSTPVSHDHYIFASAGYGTGGGLAELKRDGDKVTAKQVYFTKGLKNHHGGMVLADGYLYGADDPHFLVCLDYLTGKEMWRSEKPGKGSLAWADGMLYYRNEGGPIVLVEATPKGYAEHGRFKQPDRSHANAWPHPVLANGKLYIRDQDVLLCYDVKQH